MFELDSSKTLGRFFFSFHNVISNFSLISGIIPEF